MELLQMKMIVVSLFILRILSEINKKVVEWSRMACGLVTLQMSCCQNERK